MTNRNDVPLGRIPLERIIYKLDGLFNKNDYIEAGKLLVYWKNEAVALRDKRGELSILSELVGYYRKQNDMENGLSSIEQALKLVDDLNQGDSASGATIFINCATAYKAFGMAEKSLPLFIRAREIYEKLLSADDPRLGGLYNNMALCLTDLGDVHGAEATYRSALAVMENIPKGEAESAITYINMAHMYEKFGQGEKINACMEKAYSLLQSENLPRNGHYAFVLEKCAPSFGYFGRTDICERFKKESEEIYARA